MIHNTTLNITSDFPLAAGNLLEEFAAYAIKEYRNYGIKSTSRTKNSHAELKNHLKNRLVDLKRLLKAIQVTMTKKYEKFNIKLAHEKTAKYSKHVQIAILNPLYLKISIKALNKVYEKYIEANEYYNNKLPRFSLRSCTY